MGPSKWYSSKRVINLNGKGLTVISVRIKLTNALTQDRLPSKELRMRLGVDDIALILQQNRLRWYGHVLQKDDDWVKKCMEYEIEGPRPRGRPKRTWREVVREDCQACKMNKENATDRCKWRNMTKDVRWSGWVWVGECFFWYWPTRVVPDQRPLNGCVCVCYLSL